MSGPQSKREKQSQRTDEMAFPRHSDVPFKVIQMDFAELKKKAKRNNLTIHQCTRTVAPRLGMEDMNSAIALLSKEMFKNTIMS